MSKIVKLDQEQLSNFKWRKCILGVIHPEHTSVKKVDNDDSFSDLVITAKPAQLLTKPSWVPPASIPVKREPNPSRRPKSAKPGTNIVQEAFNSIPEAKPDRKNFFRTSVIAGKDLKNSISTYKSHLNSKKSEISQTKYKKTQYLQETQKIDQLLSEKFQTAKISDSEYTEIKNEVLKLTSEYDIQLHKQKIIINFLALKEDQLDLQELNRMFAEIQLRKEKQLIVLQHFVLRLKEECVSRARSLIAYVNVDSVSQVLNEFAAAGSQDKEILIEFLEKVKIQLRKDGLDKDSNEFLPFGCIEKVITSIYVKWEKEKNVLEGFLNDVLNLYCDEFNLSKEEVVKSKMKNGKQETVSKVVAEFINMYLIRLHNSIESKIKRLEYLKNIIENGKPQTVSWTDALLKFVKFDGSKKKVQSSEKDSSVNRSKSPQTKPERKKSKSPPQKNLKKSNVGKSAQRFKPSHLSSIPEEKKKIHASKTGKAQTSQADDEIDDIISDLNPPKGGLLGLFNAKPSSSSSKIPANPTKRKQEMDSTEGLFNFRPTKVQESRDLFGSIDAPLMKSVEKPGTDYVMRSISDIESIRFPKKPPETRSEFIKSGIRPFSAYMDKDGSYFNPQERFPDIKSSEIDPLDPYFLQSIGNLSPDPKTDWYIRSHHLRSFTNHPLSANDDPSFYKAQMELNIKDQVQNKGLDMRDEAIKHLEKTLEDLKCEINTRKRTAAVSQFEDSNGFAGHLSKAITPVAQGLDIRQKEGLVMHTYESILDELRARERAILNEKRMDAYEKNRPPQDKWYELKSNEFTDELQRHMNNLRPKEEHRKLLNNLAIPDLY